MAVINGSFSRINASHCWPYVVHYLYKVTKLTLGIVLMEADFSHFFSVLFLCLIGQKKMESWVNAMSWMFWMSQISQSWWVELRFCPLSSRVFHWEDCHTLTQSCYVFYCDDSLLQFSWELLFINFVLGFRQLSLLVSWFLFPCLATNNSGLVAGKRVFYMFLHRVLLLVVSFTNYLQ